MLDFGLDFGLLLTLPLFCLPAYPILSATVCGEQCSHPFCDSMVLSWQGREYALAAVSKTNPGLLPHDDPCKRIDGIRFKLSVQDGRLQFTPPDKNAAKSAPPKAATPAPQKVKKAEAAEPAYYHEEPSTPSTYYVGSAILRSGPVTISSRKYNIKYNAGGERGSWVQVGVVTCVADSSAGTCMDAKH